MKLVKSKKNIEKPLEEFIEALLKLYGIKLSKVVLDGSCARGNNTKDSDIDIAVVLKGKISPTREIDRMVDIITDINLKYDQLISVYPVSEENFKTLKTPLLINIRKEGITLWSR